MEMLGWLSHVQGAVDRTCGWTGSCGPGGGSRSMMDLMSEPDAMEKFSELLGSKLDHASLRVFRLREGVCEKFSGRLLLLRWGRVLIK